MRTACGESRNVDQYINRGTRDDVPDTGVNRQVRVHDLPDSVLELILLHVALDVGKRMRRVGILVRRLACVNRHFRRIVFYGPLWSASDLSTMFKVKPELLMSVLPKMDLSKVNFTGSKFCFPLKSSVEYPLQKICSLFDILGPFVRDLDLVGSDGFYVLVFSAASGVERVGAILQRCKSLSSLTTGMHLLFQRHYDLLASLDLQHLYLYTQTLEDMASSRSTISMLWPSNLQLGMTIDLSGHAGVFEVPQIIQISLTALKIIGKSVELTRLDSAGILLLTKTLVTLHVSNCTGFPVTSLVEDSDHLEKVSLQECEGLNRTVFKNCSRLQSLTFMFNKKCTELHVENCPSLSMLYIRGDGKSHPSCTIRNCPSIKNLDAAYCSIESDGINRIQKLSTLTLHDMHIVGSLTFGNNSLTVLDLTKCTVVSVIVLSGADHLEKVRLQDCVGLQRTVFKNCIRLQSLSSKQYKGCPELLVENCPSLQSLDSNVITSIINCPSIVSLNVTSVFMKSEDIIKLENLQKLTLLRQHNAGGLIFIKSLVELHLFNCPAIPEIVIVDHDHLEVVSIHHCKGLLKTVFRNCSRLKRVYFKGNCPELLVENCPLLWSLEIDSNNKKHPTICTLRNCPSISDQYSTYHCSIETDATTLRHCPSIKDKASAYHIWSSESDAIANFGKLKLAYFFYRRKLYLYRRRMMVWLYDL